MIRRRDKKPKQRFRDLDEYAEKMEDMHEWCSDRGLNFREVIITASLWYRLSHCKRQRKKTRR